ncbi:MAG: hypothetical protein ABI399_05920, partial [Bauldia sp.]
LRVVYPEDSDGIRVIGAFADRDTFIALDWHLREKMIFDEEVKEAHQRWRDLFGEIAPFHGKQLDDYLTNYRSA